MTPYRQPGEWWLRGQPVGFPGLRILANDARVENRSPTLASRSCPACVLLNMALPGSLPHAASIASPTWLPRLKRPRLTREDGGARHLVSGTPSGSTCVAAFGKSGVPLWVHVELRADGVQQALPTAWSVSVMRTNGASLHGRMSAHRFRACTQVGRWHDFKRRQPGRAD